MDAVIVDMDGTLCDVSSIRHFVAQRPKDFRAFHDAAFDCPPHAEALEYACAHHEAGRVVAIVTSRKYHWEKPTRDWLDRHLSVPYVGPFMRGDDDNRRDVEVKRDIYAILTGDYGYRIVGALDDNPAIVALWRELGIATTVVPGWDLP